MTDDCIFNKAIFGQKIHTPMPVYALQVTSLSLKQLFHDYLKLKISLK
jgi:hypothetical protein